MPYPPNSPRFEFSSSDRTSLRTLAGNLLIGLSQSHQGIPLPRSQFDAFSNTVNALTPTYNNTPPYKEVIP